MFKQKAQTDVKKSTLKFLDSKKDVPTRLKHLKLILDSVDLGEAKALFATHYSHIYHLVYEGIICTESALKTKGVHRAQRDELEGVLYLFERVIMLLPDLLHCRWQLHSISRLMAKLNHVGNSLTLRKQALRLFLMWYQCLSTSAPAYVHSMFASLVPGLPGSTAWPPPSDNSLAVCPYEITPVLPASSGDKIPEDLTAFFLEILLDFMVSQAPKIQWNDGSVMWSRSIEFLYERFKELYLPRIFPDFKITTDIYKPVLELPEPRKSADMSNNAIHTCQVVFVKWISNYAHSVYRSVDCTVPGQMSSLTSSASYGQGYHPGDEGKGISSPHSSLGDRDSIASYSSIHLDVDPNVIAKDVILGNRANINLLHEVFRRALLMNFVHTVAMRRVICVYKDWIQMNVPELPVFMLEPEEGTDEQPVGGNLDPPKNRLRADSYYGAVGINANNNKEEYLSHLRAGAQNVLQVFFSNSASVFLLFQIPKHEAAMAFLEEQVDICKRVLNIYRYAVMNTRMSSETWERLLVVLIHITSRLLEPKQSHFGLKNPDSIGSKLASALFQTLIVSWVKASLNVSLSTELWDRFQEVLSSLTICDDLITEWSKTMETLTRVLARHLYNLDLTNLPLDRLSDPKSRRKRPGQGQSSAALPQNVPIIVPPHEPLKRISAPLDVHDGSGIQKRERCTSSGTSSERRSFVFSPSTPNFRRKLKRSLSDGNLNSPKVVENESSTDSDSHPHSLVLMGSKPRQSRGDICISVAPELRRRKKSRSMDSLRTLKIATHFGHIGQPGALNPDWAEISSSTTSLGNASTIHVDDVSTLDGTGTGSTSKEELKGVISGGTVKGWLPSVSAILWRRMLGILGNVNEFTNPKTHAHFFKVLTEIWDTLHKVQLNQGVSLDNQSTPRPQELCPPLPLFAGWCFQALELPNDFFKGKIIACALLCDITVAHHDVPLSQEYLTKFYAAIHKTIIENQPELVNEIVKRCGYKFLAKMLPGFSLLLLDLSQASHAVLISDDLKKSPRMEAAAVLGAVLSVAEVCKDLPILKPNSLNFHPVTSHPTSDVVLSCLLQFAKVEQTSHARAICLQSLAMYLCKQLTIIRCFGLNHDTSDTNRSNKINSIISVLMASVKVANRSVALVATDLLLLISEFAGEISEHFSSLIPKIIQGLKLSLQQALPLRNTSWKTGKPVETEKRLLISLLRTIGEWCMKLPLDKLLISSGPTNASLLSSVFEVLSMTVKGFQSPSSTNESDLNSLEDFDPNIPLDDLQIYDVSSKSSETNAFVPSRDTLHSPSEDLETVRLAAKTIIMHLLTQIGHFPLANGSSKCGSVVAENDDLPGVNSELDELSTYIFSLPNVQMFALNQNTLLSIVELPHEDQQTLCSEEESTLGTSSSQVRLILRDLSGKSCWDATQLHRASNFVKESSGMMSIPCRREDGFYLSTLTGNFLPQLGPRLNVRRRQVGVLPTAENSADDLDNLDDLLSYIGHTSPECLQKVGEPLNVPWSPPSSITRENEDEVVSAVVNQRNSELDILMKLDNDVTMKAAPAACIASSDLEEGRSEQGDLSSLTPSIKSFASAGLSSSFMLSRRLFSQLGLTSWDKRDQIDVLKKDERLLRELKHLDAQKCRETHKIAVFYVAEGQEDKHSILSNSGGSEAYEDFVSGLGWEVDLETHTGFLGGLQRNKSTGETAPYYATSFTEVIFHVATRMPSATEENLLHKTRHLGNDEVHIVWSEHCRDYRREIIPTEFCDVLIVIYPLKFGLFRVQVSKKPEVPYFGPLFNEAIVDKDVLSVLVRSTAINASRAKQSSLQYFQHYFQERAKSLSGIVKNHKNRTTFESFASNVFCPVLPPPAFSGGVSNSNRASVAGGFSSNRTPLFSSSTITADSSSNMSAGSSQLSTALLDSVIPPRRPAYDIPFTPPEIRSGRSSGFSGENSIPVSPIPPVPPKKLSLQKLGSALKPKLHTPPSSPHPPLKLQGHAFSK